MENIGQNFESEIRSNMELILTRLDLIEQKAGLSGKEVLTSEEAAAFLGVTTNWLYQQTNRKQIPHYKNGGKRTYYKRSELESWMCRGRVSTNEEIEQRALNR